MSDPTLNNGDEESDITFLFDTDISGYSLNSIKAIYERTWFNLVLHGLRNSFNRIIQSNSPIEYTFTDRFKELLLSRTKGKLAYPYAYIVVNDVDLVKDQINTGAMARSGIINPHLKGDAVPMSYLFPFKMNITLNVIDSDINSLFSLMQAIFLSDVSRSFNFGIKAFETLSKVKVARTGNIGFSENTISTDQEPDFGTGHITCSFEVQGWMGFTAFVPTLKTLNVNVISEGLDGSNEKLVATYKIALSEGSNK